MGQQTTLERRGTTLGQVRGLGSAHEGAHHWLLRRFTAAGNLLTVLYLVFSVLLLLPDLSYDTVFRWLSQPAGALPVALLIVSVFWHARLGLQVMIEDYVHGPGTKFAAMLVLNLATFGAAGFGLLCVARIVATAIGLEATQGIVQAMQAMQQGGMPGAGM